MISNLGQGALGVTSSAKMVVRLMSRAPGGYGLLMHERRERTGHKNVRN